MWYRTRPEHLGADRLKSLERENRELKRANELLRKAATFSRRRSSIADRSDGSFIDQQLREHGIGSICQQLPIASLPTFVHKVRQAEPAKQSLRQQRDQSPLIDIRRGWEDNYQVCGPRKFGLNRIVSRSLLHIVRWSTNRFSPVSRNN